VLTVIRFGRHVSRRTGRRLALFGMRRLRAIVVVRHGFVLFWIYSAATGRNAVFSSRVPRQTTAFINLLRRAAV
jgi:hypothetical protein